MNDAVRAAEASTLSAKPATKPTPPYFSSGPCAKPPGWAAEQLATHALGRSHRSKLGKNRFQLAIALTSEMLRVPDMPRTGIVLGSDTCTVEMTICPQLVISTSNLDIRASVG